MHDVRAKTKFRIRSDGSHLPLPLVDNGPDSVHVCAPSRPHAISRFNRACYLPSANIRMRIRWSHLWPGACVRDKSSLVRTVDVIEFGRKRDTNKSRIYFPGNSCWLGASRFVRSSRRLQFLDKSLAIEYFRYRNMYFARRVSLFFAIARQRRCLFVAKNNFNLEKYRCAINISKRNRSHTYFHFFLKVKTNIYACEKFGNMRGIRVSLEILRVEDLCVILRRHIIYKIRVARKIRQYLQKYCISKMKSLGNFNLALLSNKSL